MNKQIAGIAIKQELKTGNLLAFRGIKKSN